MMVGYLYRIIQIDMSLIQSSVRLPQLQFLSNMYSTFKLVPPLNLAYLKDRT